MDLWGGKKLKIRRILFALLILLTAVFFHCGFIPDFFSVPAMVLIPLIVSIAMNEKSLQSMFFGLFAGALWDMGSAAADGYFTVLLAATGFLASSLNSFLIRKSLRSCLILTLGFGSLINFSYWLLFFLRRGYEGALGALFEFYLPSAVYTALFALIYYYLVSAICKDTKEKKKH